MNKVSIKGDHQFNSKHRISGYYGYDRESTVPGPDGPATLPGNYTNYSDLRQYSDVVRFSWDWTLSPTALNHFFAGGNNWRQYLNKGPAAWILGNRGINGVLTYSSGQRVGVTSSYVLPLYGSNNGRTIPYITSYNGWQPNYSGKFDPSIDNFFVPYCSTGTAACNGPFPYQGVLNSGQNIGFGNSTRYNPSLRQFANLNENLSVARSFPLKGEGRRLEFGAEGFNVFNRTRFGTGSLSLQDPNFGHLTSSADLLNTPRQLQLALKLYF